MVRIYIRLRTLVWIASKSGGPSCLLEDVGVYFYDLSIHLQDCTFCISKQAPFEFFVEKRGQSQKTLPLIWGTYNMSLRHHFSHFIDKEKWDCLAGLLQMLIKCEITK